jgi:choline dehydrogenase-like flavoprotein
VIHELATLDASFVLEADLCIVGAGAAGLALASEFLESKWRVIVLESGLRQPDAAGEALNELACVGQRHDGWREGRIRALGGTTRAWGGQLIPLRASELEVRRWMPLSGWPLTLDELQPYYRRVEQMLSVEGPPYDETLWRTLGIPPPDFDANELRVRFSQWAALGRRNFAVLWRRRLEQCRNVTVLLDATAIAVECNPTGEHCEAIAVRSRSGRAGSVRARAFVICCGGIETARLLLASPSADSAGVANRSGFVGRCFQDHISFTAGEIATDRRRAIQNIFDPRYIGNTMYSLKIEPTDSMLREQRWLHVMAHVAFQVPDALGWMELRRLLRSVQAGHPVIPSFDEAVAMLRGGSQLARLLLVRYLRRRRTSPAAGRMLLMVDCEQAPNPDSRVLLDTRVDALGQPRAKLDWRITELERDTLVGFAGRMAREFERLGLGPVRLAGEPDFNKREELGAARDIFHHMGTTRMANDPAMGVTQADLRCHDVDNLYIAGPSVFPTSGIANPTFTALAISLRLADHLRSSL